MSCEGRERLCSTNKDLRKKLCGRDDHRLGCARERVDLIASKLNSEDPNTVTCALGALESFGEFAGAHADAVRRKLPPASKLLPSDETWYAFHWMRIHAMGTLSAIRTSAAPHVDAIAAYLELKRGGDLRLIDEMHRAHAALALGRLGEVARHHVDAVAALLTAEETSFVRRMALKALEAFGELAKPHVRDIAQMLSNESDWAIRVAAAETLGELGEVARDHVDAVAAMLVDYNPRIRVSALKSLGAFGPLAKPHVERIAAMIDDDDPDVRARVIESLGKLGSTARDHVDAVAAILNAGKDPKDEINAISALGSFGTLGMLEERHVEMLRKKLHSNDRSIGASAAKTLGELGKMTLEDDVDVVARMLSGDTKIKEKALEAFGTFGEFAKPHVKRIAAMLSDKNEVVIRREAAKTLGKLGEVARDHVDDVAKMLYERGYRDSAVEALGAFGKLARKYARHPVFKLDAMSPSDDGINAYLHGVRVGKALLKMYGV